MQAEGQQSSRERRSAIRTAIALPAAIRRSCDKQKPVTLGCLSRTGCGVNNAVNLRAGDRVWVRLPGLEAQLARVRWAQLASAGIEFDQPLHPVVLENVLKLAPKAAAAA